MARYEPLVEVVEKLRKAMISEAASIELTEAMMVLAQAGKQLNSSDTKKIFRQLFRELASLTRTGELEFAVDALQKVYDKEVKGKMSSFDNAFDWFIGSESRLVDDIRKLFSKTGREELRFYLHLSDDRLISAGSILRNDYLAEISDDFFDMISDPRHGLAEFLKDFADRGIIGRFQETGMIGEESFWRIKGRIMEILCDAIKREQFLAPLAAGNSRIELFEGVMAMTRMTKEGKVSASVVPRQIWDGVIAEIQGSKLIIHRVFEIKSGLHGFQQGYDQVLATVYHRFVSGGDKLIVTLKDGSKRVFVNDPKAVNGIRFETRQTVLLTPDGVSSHLPNQRFSAGMGDIEIETQLLKIGEREVHADDIEALVMDFLNAYKP